MARSVRGRSATLSLVLVTVLTGWLTVGRNQETMAGNDRSRPGQQTPVPPAGAPPNVVIIFADDMGYGDPGCFGGKAAPTPWIDRLAREGIRLTDFHVAQAVCSASRAALLTGCYPNRLGIHGALGPRDSHGLAAAETTLAELLRDRGYRTCLVGKWHLGHLPEFLPTRQGFDEYFGLPYSNDMWPHHPAAKPGRYPPLPLFENETVIDPDITPADQEVLTRRYAERAVRFIREAGATPGRPFFLYLAHSMPHVPLFAGEGFRGTTAGGLYGDVIAEIDASVGAVLAAIEETGNTENTLVLFTSDNGPWLSYGNHAGSAGPLREGKGTAFEGGVRVPCVARLPGRIPAGTVSDEPLMTIDLVPSIASLTGEPLPQDENGRCLINGQPIDGHDRLGILCGAVRAPGQTDAYLFYYKVNELQAVREGDWKLVLPHTYRTMQGQAPGEDGTPGTYRQQEIARSLYDLASDPGEQRDVAGDHPEIVARLERIAEAAREDLGDSLTKREGRGVRQPDRLRLTGPRADGRILLLANRDDDDRDGMADADDDRVNGPADRADLAAVAIESGDPRITGVVLTCDAPEVIACFREDDGRWRPLLPDEVLPLADGRREILVECRSWAAVESGWNGRGRLTAVGQTAVGDAVARAEIPVEVAAVVLLPETQPVREVFVSRGRYDNEAFVARLRSVLDQLGVPLRVHDAGAWQEMWMQDTMELGATALPRHDDGAGAGMTVVLAGLRGVDPVPPTLLGPDVAVAEVAKPRPLAGGDAWADWYGNLMASPATEAWPHGRVIFGRNVATGAEFHPAVIGFLAAQRVQSPVWIDTSWLLIKHVDEIVAFLPGRDGRGCLLVVDPLAGLEQARAAGLESAVGPRAEAFAETNRRIAAIVEAMLGGGGVDPRSGVAQREEAGDRGRGGLMALLGWNPERVVRLPVAFEVAGDLPDAGITDATSLWSNPVNALFVNGTVLCGDAGMPAAVVDACRDAFLAAGASRVEFLDDACYHRMKGNVHCATNARREW